MKNKEITKGLRRNVEGFDGESTPQRITTNFYWITLMYMNFFTAQKRVKFSVFTQNLVRVSVFTTMFFMTASAMADDVAKIGNTTYSSLKEAIDAVPNNGIATAISLVKDISTDKGFIISDNKNIILNLEGKSIEITNNSIALTVDKRCQLSINGDGAIKNTADDYHGKDYRACIWAEEDSKITINGGNFSNDALTPTITTYGELYINYGSFENKGMTWVISCLKYYGEIYNGKFKGYYTLNNCHIYGGLHSANNVYTNKDFYKFIPNTDPNTNKTYPYTIGYPVIKDGAEYKNEKDLELKGYSLTYCRHFENTEWQQLYVPFDIPANIWREYFEIAETTDFKNGKFIITKLDQNENVEANNLYMIRAKKVASNGEDIYISVPDAKIKASAVTEKRLSEGTLFTCNGFLDKGRWMNIANGKCYTIINGKLSQYDLSGYNDDVIVMTPQRWFLSADHPVNTSYEIKVNAGTTAIDNVTNESDNNDIIYNLTGQRVNKDAKGIVIINGKKQVLNLHSR